MWDHTCGHLWVAIQSPRAACISGNTGVPSITRRVLTQSDGLVELQLLVLFSQLIAHQMGRLPVDGRHAKSPWRFALHGCKQQDRVRENSQLLSSMEAWAMQ